MKVRKILAITGIRSEYDILYPVLKAINSNKGFSLGLIVTGAHLSANYGYTIEQIKKDNFRIVAEIDSLIEGRKPSNRLKGAAVQILGLIQQVEIEKPDILMVLGDREESITTALVGTYLSIPVCHLCGGDKVIGNIDDVIRHAVTKLSHIHFTTNEESKERVLKLGEEAFRVFNVGNPGLDRFRQINKISKAKLFSFYGFNKLLLNKPLLLIIQHPLSSEYMDSYKQMKETMEAVKKLQFPTVISYPNTDAGNQDIIKCIQEYKNLPFVKVYPNIPRLEFFNTLRWASCLVGNSSLGLLEAPFLKLGVVNVGNRQKGRLHSTNLFFVPHDRGKISSEIEKICYDKTTITQIKNCKSPYGDGYSSKKIVEILSSIKLNKKLLIKEITYD